jgi:hypothetical protein
MRPRSLGRVLPALMAAFVLICSGCDYRFVSWADSRGSSSGTVNAPVVAGESRQIARKKPAFTMFPGDLCESGPSNACMLQWLGAANGGTRVSNGLANRTFVTRGNHDSSGLAVINAWMNPQRIARVVGVKNYTRNGTALTYAFDFLNDHFVAVDLPAGDVSSMTAGSIAWLDANLTQADSRRVVNEFLFWHGPLVCVSTSHSCKPPAALVRVLNKHARIRAAFFGHEHVNAHVHLSGANVPGLTHPFEEFVDGTAGAPHYTCKAGVVGENFCVNYDAFDTIDVTAGTTHYKVSVFRLGISPATKVFKY